MGGRNHKSEPELALLEEGVQAIRRVMTYRGMTQADLGAVLGITQGSVSNTLNQPRALSLATLARFLDAMGYRAHITLEEIND